jgi:hypothetical protein
VLMPAPENKIHFFDAATISAMLSILSMSGPP